MNIRQDIAARLRAGIPQAYICRELRCAPITVQRTREALGLPAPKAGPPRPPSIEAEFQRLAEPIDGGHARWNGKHTGGAPIVVWRGTTRSAYRIAFELHHGRPPVGRVTSSCEVRGCIAGRCVEDQPMRAKTHALYASVFGGAS
jgi:hypothetical protein